MRRCPVFLLLAVLAGSSLSFAGCAKTVEYDDGVQGGDDDDDDGQTPTPTPPPGPTIEEVVDDGCTTSVVRPLSEQLIAELNCLSPDAVSLIPYDSQLDVGNIFDFLQTPAGDTLPSVLDERPGTTMTVNSALRSLAQQYLLYQWYLDDRCGIALAAAPGTSNHERGLAIDINDSSGWRTPLESHDWSWLGANDPVHYDFEGSGTVDIQGLSVRAFQRLWNLNNPDDEILEDGLYGPQTESRLAISPVNGFAEGSTCGEPSAIVPFRWVLEIRPETCGL